MLTSRYEYYLLKQSSRINFQELYFLQKEIFEY